MTPDMIEQPLSVERAARLVDFISDWLARTEHVADWRLGPGRAVQIFKDGCWQPCGTIDGWLRLARALGALRSE